MCLTQIFVKQDAVADSHHTVHAIDEQEDEPCHILSSQYQRADHKQQNVRHPDRAHITRKALRLTLRTEIEQAEHHIGQHHYIDQALIHKAT